MPPKILDWAEDDITRRYLDDDPDYDNEDDDDYADDYVDEILLERSEKC